MLFLYNHPLNRFVQYNLRGVIAAHEKLRQRRKNPAEYEGGSEGLGTGKDYRGGIVGGRSGARGKRLENELLYDFSGALSRILCKWKQKHKLIYG